jgi:hypothetical protein
MLVRRFDLDSVLRIAGVNLPQALGHAARRGPLVWTMCTPIAEAGSPVDSSRFYKSVRDNVDTVEKRTHFMIMMNAIARAASVEDYGSVLSGSAVATKPAHSFKAFNSTHRILELKHNKKERVYFYPHTVGSQRYLIFLLAEHKRDQTTPKHVCNYTETIVQRLVDSREQLTCI